LFTIKSKFFVQGLYQDQHYVYLTHNQKGIDAIIRIEKNDFYVNKSFKESNLTLFNAPGSMVEDIVVYNNHLITSDEETNMIYISTDSLSQ
jgi:hypothetical protein